MIVLYTEQSNVMKINWNFKSDLDKMTNWANTCKSLMCCFTLYQITITINILALALAYLVDTH